MMVLILHFGGKRGGGSVGIVDFIFYSENQGFMTALGNLGISGNLEGRGFDG